jgi:hypothetical protein
MAQLVEDVLQSTALTTSERPVERSLILPESMELHHENTVVC